MDIDNHDPDVISDWQCDVICESMHSDSIFLGLPKLNFAQVLCCRPTVICPYVDLAADYKRARNSISARLNARAHSTTLLRSYKISSSI